MRRSGSAGAPVALSALCAVLLSTVLLSACQSTPGATTAADGRLGGGTAGAATTVRPSGYGAVFLAVDECSSFGTTSFTEVACASERAAARVVARHDGREEGGPPCPATTDFVLHISEQRPSSDEDGDGAVPRGYACMRNLQPPHPGDPGGGGGPRTIVGDCVYEAGGDEVRETACAGTGERAPQYKVVDAVTDRARCPAATALYVRLGGERPVGCARPV
ncbi:hypothetical protein [Streptomyces sp. NPDC090994]|uniref:hypothetical protein n=1 Tax=Streptomyces sp. NPDC090994 TaxID=3365969 RepID=UPI00380CADA7